MFTLNREIENCIIIQLLRPYDDVMVIGDLGIINEDNKFENKYGQAGILKVDINATEEEIEAVFNLAVEV